LRWRWRRWRRRLRRRIRLREWRGRRGSGDSRRCGRADGDRHQDGDDHAPRPSPQPPAHVSHDDSVFAHRCRQKGQLSCCTCSSRP
jgi:hypothetical protein